MATLKYEKISLSGVDQVKLTTLGDELIIACKDVLGKVQITRAGLPDMGKFNLKLVVKGNVREAYFDNCATVFGNIGVAEADNCISNEGKISHPTHILNIDPSYKCLASRERYRAVMGKEDPCRNKIIHIDGDITYISGRVVGGLSFYPEIYGNVVKIRVGNCLDNKGTIGSVYAGNRCITTDGKSASRKSYSASEMQDIDRYLDDIFSQVKK